MKIELVAAGNVETPAYLTLLSLGFKVTCNGDTWMAENDSMALSAEGPIELLGLLKIIEVRGAHWQATDDEIEDFVAKFCS